MTQKEDQSRLLIATFIVATTVALLISDMQIAIDPNGVWALIIGVGFFSLLISATLSFLYVICKGYELRHKQPNTKNFIDKNNYLLYDWSIKSYPWVIGILLYTLAYDFLKHSSEINQLWTTLLMWFVAFLFTIFLNRKTLIELVTYIQNRKQKKR